MEKKRKKNPKKRIHAWVSEEVHYHLELAADRLGLTLTEFVRSTMIQKARETMKG